MKSNARIIPDKVVREIEKIEWDNMPDQTKANLLKLLQAGQSPENIEAHMLSVISKNYPHLPDWKKRAHAARYCMAASHALANNLHLNS